MELEAEECDCYLVLCSSSLGVVSSPFEPKEGTGIVSAEAGA